MFCPTKKRRIKLYTYKVYYYIILCRDAGAYRLRSSHVEKIPRQLHSSVEIETFLKTRHFF